MTVLVLGAHGQLGSAITRRFQRGGRVVAYGRAELDISDWASVRPAIRAVGPTVIVNCAAYTHVDRAEQEPGRAFQVNAGAVRWLARAAEEAGAILVHYSTDFVFDGGSATPYTETDVPNPQGAYAMSKLVGEWFAAEAPQHYVLRVESLFGGVPARSSIDRMRADMLRHRVVKAFADRTVSPSYVDDVAEATGLLIKNRAPCGLYHCVSTGQTNWWSLAKELARLIARPDATIVPTSLSDARLYPPRPLHAALSNAKLRQVGIVMPTWQDALMRHVQAPPPPS